MRRDIINKIATHRGLVECIDRIEQAASPSQLQSALEFDPDPANEDHFYTYVLRYINELEDRIKTLEIKD